MGRSESFISLKSCLSSVNVINQLHKHVISTDWSCITNYTANVWAWGFLARAKLTFVEISMRIVAELVAIVVATATTNAPLYNQSTQVNRNIVDSINFNFYQDSNHTLQLMQAYLGEQIYARVETDPTVENLNLQINSCYATSTSDSGTKFLK